MGTRAQELRPGCDRKVQKDTHHLLFFRKDWRKGVWSRRLREHPYMEVLIPTATLHCDIHKVLKRGVPKPSETACEIVWHELESLRTSDLIDTRHEGIERRINVAVELLGCCGEDTDDTIYALLTQKYIARKFYQGSL